MDELAREAVEALAGEAIEHAVNPALERARAREASEGMTPPQDEETPRSIKLAALLRLFAGMFSLLTLPLLYVLKDLLAVDFVLGVGFWIVLTVFVVGGLERERRAALREEAEARAAKGITEEEAMRAWITRRGRADSASDRFTASLLHSWESWFKMPMSLGLGSLAFCYFDVPVGLGIAAFFLIPSLLTALVLATVSAFHHVLREDTVRQETVRVRQNLSAHNPELIGGLQVDDGADSGGGLAMVDAQVGGVSVHDEVVLDTSVDEAVVFDAQEGAGEEASATVDVAVEAASRRDAL